MPPRNDGDRIRTERLTGRAEALLAEVRSLPPWERARLARSGVSETDVAVLFRLLQLIEAAEIRSLGAGSRSLTAR